MMAEDPHTMNDVLKIHVLILCCELHLKDQPDTSKNNSLPTDEDG